MVQQIEQEDSRRFETSGKHRKSLKKIIKIIEDLGFEFVSQEKHVIFKHPTRGCSIVFASNPSDANAVRQIVRRLKKDLIHCQPPIDVNSLPASINQLRIKGIGKMEDEPTIGDELDACVEDNFSSISTEMTTDSKEKLEMLSDQKEITMGGLIEEIMDSYQKKLIRSLYRSSEILSRNQIVLYKIKGQERECYKRNKKKALKQ